MLHFEPLGFHGYLHDIASSRESAFIYHITFYEQLAGGSKTTFSLFNDNEIFTALLSVSPFGYSAQLICR
jgi:hypothetical protein